MKKILYAVIALILATAVAGCGGPGGGSAENGGEPGNKESEGSSPETSSEDYFEWDGNLITAVTQAGSKESSILIPARCEGFAGVIFQGTGIEHVAFEDDDNIALDFAFMGAENLVSVELPANLTTIPTMAFKSCDSLSSITIPASVTAMESYAFSACGSLAEVVFEGEGLTAISENCFEDCALLEAVRIPEGVTSVGSHAFFNCSALKNVTFSSTVSEIADFAFGNTAVEEIHFPAEMEITAMNESAFGTNAYTAAVYITQGSWCDKNQSLWDIGFGEIKYE